MKYPYPIKDWKDESQYKNIKSFAWEFLRRSASYQRDYEKSKDERAKTHGFMYRMMDKYAGVAKTFNAGGKNMICCPDPLKDCGDNVSFNKLDDCAIYLHENLDVLKEIHGGLAELGLLMVPFAPSRVTITFDVDDIDTLKLQIITAERTLLEQAEKQNNKLDSINARMPRKNKLVSYLRALDAVAAGASEQDMINTLEPNTTNDYETGYLAKQRIINHIKAGQKMAESGYQKLASFEYKQRLK